MDFEDIAEFHCAICTEPFGSDEKCPRMLTCGHSFCQACLKELMVQKSTCPDCNKEILLTEVDSAPVNNLIQNLVLKLSAKSAQGQKRKSVFTADFRSSEDSDGGLSNDYSQRVKKRVELMSEGYCDEHGIDKHFRCMDCLCWICGDCSTLHHKLHNTILVEDAFPMMKKEVLYELQKKLQRENDQNANVSKYLTVLEEQRLTLKEEIKNIQMTLRHKKEALHSLGKCMEELQSSKTNRNQFCSRIKTLAVLIEGTKTLYEFVDVKQTLNRYLEYYQGADAELSIPKECHSSLSIEILKKLEEASPVYALRVHRGTTILYGKLSVKGNQIWIRSFCPQMAAGNNIVISFRCLLLSIKEDLKLPSKVFMQIKDETISEDDTTSEDIIIVVDRDNSRALNFNLLCSGITGVSYEGVRLKVWKEVFGTCDAEVIVLVKGISIKMEDALGSRMKRGLVGCWDVEDYKHTGFSIAMKHYHHTSLVDKFGYVEEGIDACAENFQVDQLLIVSGCGFVL